MSSTSSPCAACKFLRRKCTQGCVFAPYFPPDQPHKFAHVHRVFGASNVAKLLNELPTSQREDAVNSLAYEAEARLRDPVYGCVRYISILQTKLKEVQLDLYNAKKELAAYIGPSALTPFVSPHLGFTVPNSFAQFGFGPIQQQQQQQHQPQQQLVLQQPVQHHQHQLAVEQQQQQQQAALIAAAREQEIMMMRFNGLYDGREQQVVGFASSSSSQELVLLPAEDQLNLHHQHHHEQQQQQHQFVEQQQQQQQQGMQNEEGRSSGAGGQ